MKIAGEKNTCNGGSLTPNRIRMVSDGKKKFNPGKKEENSGAPANFFTNVNQWKFIFNKKIIFGKIQFYDVLN